MSAKKTTTTAKVVIACEALSTPLRGGTLSGGAAFFTHEDRSCGDSTAIATKAATGWPAPALMQDDCRKLFAWFAHRPGARRLVLLSSAGSPQERRE